MSSDAPTYAELSWKLRKAEERAEELAANLSDMRGRVATLSEVVALREHQLDGLAKRLNEYQSVLGWQPVGELEELLKRLRSIASRMDGPRPRKTKTKSVGTADAA